MYFKIFCLFAAFTTFVNSEFIRWKKTIPISKQSCPCWWDLEGKLIDPKTEEPYKCACCKKGGVQCGYPLHEWCTDNKKNRRGCIGKLFKVPKTQRTIFTGWTNITLPPQYIIKMRNF